MNDELLLLSLCFSVLLGPLIMFFFLSRNADDDEKEEESSAQDTDHLASSVPVPLRVPTQAETADSVDRATEALKGVDLSVTDDGEEDCCPTVSVSEVAAHEEVEVAWGGNDRSAKLGSLQAELETEVRRINEWFPRGNLKQLTREIEALNHVKVTDSALGVGEKIPSFRLKAQNGRYVSSQQLLQHGPLVISFFHGYWSSLCMIELRDLQRMLHRFQSRGAFVVGISPDSPSNAQRSAAKSGAKFPLLSDKNNSVARKFRLLYQMDAVLPGTFSDPWPLPLVATYVIDRDGKVLHLFVNCDHSKRAEPSALLDALPGRPKLESNKKAQSSRSWRLSKGSGWVGSWRSERGKKMT
jgi:peroxiredoxin